MRGDSGNPKYTGKVKWFNNKSGFGFITVVNECELSGKDIFAHHSSIVVKENIYKYLVQGEYVEFTIHQVETKKKDEQLLKKLSLEEYFSIDHNDDHDDDTINIMLQEIKEQQSEEANKEEGNDHNDHKSDKSNDDDDSDNDDDEDDEDISITDHNEEGINNIMMTSFEEEIGLNEAMLESLHVKLLALEEEIEQEK